MDDHPGNGLPTGTAQSWPGSPCGGLILPVAPVGSEVGASVIPGAAGAPAGGTVMEVASGVGDPSSGAPTGISHRCPGSPWGGFNWAVGSAWDVGSGVLADAGVVSSADAAGCSWVAAGKGAGSSTFEQEAMATERASVAVAQVKVVFISGRFRNGVIAEFCAKIAWFDRAFPCRRKAQCLKRTKSLPKLSLSLSIRWYSFFTAGCCK